MYLGVLGMNHDNSVRLLYLLLLHAQAIKSASKHPKHGNIDVEYFLKKAIVSEKFEEMAEKIADKAVEKFMKLQLGDDMHGLKSKDTVYRVSEKDVEQPNNSNEEVATTLQEISKENEKMESTTNTHLKIDKEALKKKDSILLKELSLKFNKFTNKSIYRQQSKEGIDSKLTDIEETSPNTPRDISSEEPTTSTIKPKEVSNESEVAIKISAETMKDTAVKTAKSGLDSAISKELQSHDLSTKDNNHEENVEDDKIFKENIQPIKDSKRKKKESNELVEDKSTDLINTSEVNIEEPIKTQTKGHGSDSYKVRQPTYEYLQVPLPEKKNKINKSEVTSKEESTEIKVDTAENIEKTENNTIGTDVSQHKNRTIFLRSEGNKLYTQERIPDYEDYHHEVLRIQKQLKESKRRAKNLIPHDRHKKDEPLATNNKNIAEDI